MGQPEEAHERRRLTHKDFRRLMQLLTTQQIIANGLARYQFTEQCRKVVVFSPWRRMLRLAHWAVEGTLAVVGVGGPGHRLVGGVPAAS